VEGRTGNPEGRSFSRTGKRPTEQQRIHALESENRRLRMERDILKKTTAFFAKESA
jgi:transposase-like protein